MSITRHYQNSQRRLFLLDYDGTLVDFAPAPADATPHSRILNVLTDLSNDPRNTVVVVSGRDRHTLEEWLGHLPVALTAEHGLFHRPVHGSWNATRELDQSWKPPVRRLMESVQVPGSHLEEKSMSLVWHYRQCEDVEVAEQAAAGLTKELRLHTPHKIMPGHKIVEVTASGTDKGQAARFWLTTARPDFVLAAGDDVTDEDLFRALPAGAYKLNIGTPRAIAAGPLPDPAAMLDMLTSLYKK
jgi:trehalose 6-phosphate synthase/phosphatase